MVTSYQSVKVFSLESFPLYGIYFNATDSVIALSNYLKHTSAICIILDFNQDFDSEFIVRRGGGEIIVYSNNV